MFYANGQKGKAGAKTNWPYPTIVEEAININGTLYAPCVIVTDVYEGVHVRGTDTYQYCFSCGKVFPVNDPHFTEGCNEN